MERKRGGQPGNQNARKENRVWRDAINRALSRRSASRTDGIEEIDALADELLKLVALGDLGALKEFGDRMDGKAPLSIGSDPDNPLPEGTTNIFVNGVPVADRSTTEGG